MKRERIEKVLRMMGAKVPENQGRSGWVVSSCPLAEWEHGGGVDRNPSFGVMEKRPNRVKCFSCGFSGSLQNLVLELKKHKPFGIGFRELWDTIEADDDIDLETNDWSPDGFEPVTDDAWPEWFLDSFLPVTRFAHVMEYLEGRNVPEWVASNLDLRYDSTRRRICFPIRNWDGELTGLHGRAIYEEDVTETNPKYFQYGYRGSRNPQVWLGEQWIDPDRPVVLVESVFDLASVLRVYDNVMAALYAYPQRSKVRRLMDCYELVWFFDNDMAGKKGQGIASSILEDSINWFVQYPLEWEKSDPGDMSIDELKECLGAIVSIDKRTAID